MRSFNHSRHGSSSYVQRFSARIFHLHNFFILPPSLSFHSVDYNEEFRDFLFFFPNPKFFRLVGTCLKIDVPLLFSYAVRLGHDQIYVWEWLKEWARVHSFDVGPVPCEQHTNTDENLLIFIFTLLFFFGPAIHEKENTQTCKTKIYLPTNTGVLISL